MKETDLGFNKEFEEEKAKLGMEDFDYARVVQEHKDRYLIKTTTQEYDAELMGNLRYTAESRYDYPAVGDWVVYQAYDDDKAIIHAILPRQSLIERRAAGKNSEVQIIAANIDYGLIVQSVDRNFNLNRIERYLSICNTSKVTPIIVLNKTDLISKEELDLKVTQVKERISNIKVICVSMLTIGYSSLQSIIVKGKTYCLLGSSGVGKSTLINGLIGEEKMSTSAISTAVNKGKHTTTHRELIVLEQGGILIDNPGMREIGLTDKTEGLTLTFESILDYATDCKYKDCSHMHEDGCAVREAVANGNIHQAAYDNFIKMERERAHFESDALERRKKDRDFGKMVKNVKNYKKGNL